MPIFAKLLKETNECAFLQRLTLGLIKVSTSEPYIHYPIIIGVYCPAKAPQYVVSGENSVKKKYNLLLAGNRFIDFNFSKQFKLF